MPGPLAMAALVKGGAAVGGYLFNKFLGNKPKPFGKTPYGELLKKRSEQGIYSPGVRREIVGRVGREAGNIASNAAASYRGRLISRGIGGSIAGARGLGEIMTRPIDAVSRTRQDIDRENELSKVQASEQLAIGQTDYQQALQQREERLKSELVGGLVNAGGGYLTGRANEKAFAGIDFSDEASVQKWIAGQPDQAAAVNLLRNLASASQYGQGRTDRWSRVKRSIADYQSIPNRTEATDRQFLLDLKSHGLTEKDIDMIVKMLEN